MTKIISDQHALRDKIAAAIWNTRHGYDGGDAQANAVLCALHGEFYIIAREVTEEMCKVGAEVGYDGEEKYGLLSRAEAACVFRIMAIVGDLTSCPDNNNDNSR